MACLIKRIVIRSTNQRSFRGHGGVVRGPASPNMGHKSVRGDLAFVVMFVKSVEHVPSRTEEYDLGVRLRSGM